MGWASGSEIMDEVIHAVNKVDLSEADRVKIFLEVIDALEDRDWDTQDDCLGSDPAFDKALKLLHPDW